MASGITIDNLAAFRRDLNAAEKGAGRELTAALKRAGIPVVARTKGLAAKDTGRLASGYKVSVRGTNAWMTNTAPYAAGAEWGRRGKWSGFMRYGGPGRFAARAVDQLDDVIAESIYRELDELVTIKGWAR